MQGRVLMTSSDCIHRRERSKTPMLPPLTHQDDCYYSEFAALVGVVDGTCERGAILSPYEDAVETYRLVRNAWLRSFDDTLIEVKTWDITLAGDAAFQARRG